MRLFDTDTCKHSQHGSDVASAHMQTWTQVGDHPAHVLTNVFIAFQLLIFMSLSGDVLNFAVMTCNDLQ